MSQPGWPIMTMAADLTTRLRPRTGVHLYCDPGPIVMAHGPFLLIHKGSTGDRRLGVELPKPHTLVDLYTCNTVATQTTRFEMGAQGANRFPGTAEAVRRQKLTKFGLYRSLDTKYGKRIAFDLVMVHRRKGWLNMRPRHFVCAMIHFACSIFPFSPATAQDGLEAQQWVGEKWGNPVRLQAEDMEGRGKVLRATCEHGKQDKAIFSIARQWNAKELPFVVLDTRNDFHTEVGVAVAVSTGGEWTYFESSLRRPPKGGEFTRLVFDLSQPNFKCEKYHWIQGLPIENLNDVRKLFLVLFPQNRQEMGGVMHIDGIFTAKGLFEERPLAEPPFSMETDTPAALGDFNNDGLPDRVTFLPTFVLEKGDPGGKFADITASFKVGQPMKAGTWLDIDRDGFQDLETLSGNASRPRLLLGNGAGVFSEATNDWVFPSRLLPAGIRRVVAYDEEPDGDEDLYFEQADGSWLGWEHVSIHGERGTTALILHTEGAQNSASVRVSDEKGKSMGARQVVSSKATKPSAFSQAAFFVPPGRYSITVERGGKQSAAMTVQVDSPIQRVAITQDAVFALYPPRGVEIDGKMRPGEWDDAAKITDTLSYLDVKTKQEEVHSMTMWYRADSYGLYLCVKIEGDDFGDSLNADMLHVFFDNNADGVIKHGEDVRSFWSHIFNDYYLFQRPDRLWTERDPFLDGRGAVEHSNRNGIGDYVYELLIPWLSHDELDIAVSGDATLGLKVVFTETRKHGDYWMWGQGGLGKDGFPDSMHESGHTYAKLKVTGLSRTHGTPPGKVEVSIEAPKPGRTLRGQVVSQDGKPVPSARVTLSISSSPSGGQRVTTDAEGRYDLPFAPPPADAPADQRGHWVLVTSPNYAAMVKQVRPADQECNFALAPGLPLSGTVLDPEGQALPDAELIVDFGKFRWFARQGRTDAEGRFRFEHLPEEELRFVVTHHEKKLYHSQPVKAGVRDLTINVRSPARVQEKVKAP